MVVNIICMVVGFILGIAITSVLAQGKISDIEMERHHAEHRAMQHGLKLSKIEQIIRLEEHLKTPAVHIVDKLKEVIQSPNTNNF